MSNVAEFFAFARERYAIRQRKLDGQAPPWTEDPVLQRFYFCNVYREHDKTTQWFRERIREPLWNDPKVLMATICFRWFNRIETGELIEDVLLNHGYNRRLIEKQLRPLQQRGEQLFTGAYLIKSPPGMDKLTGLLNCMDVAVAAQNSLIRTCRYKHNLQEAHEMFMLVPYLGKFMAYEVVTDLRHTYLLENAMDISAWASAGPGCARGLEWVFPEEGPFHYGSKKDQERMLALMQHLLHQSRKVRHWPHRPLWEMREVEHVLCEYDKYCRGKAGQRLKRLYRLRTEDNSSE